EEIADQDWERSWMDNFKPMRFGRRLWIVPSWHEAPEPDAVNLLLDPGLAFGTGTHPTTALCLEWLDSQGLDGLQVIDFGCGSGILAIAALLLGADRVTGTDIDPQALEASRDNAQRNQLADERLPLYLPADMPAEPADILVANILAGPLVSLAPQLTGLVKPGGRIALSGILAEQTEEILAAYRDAFELDPVADKDGWLRVSGVRGAAQRLGGSGGSGRARGGGPGGAAAPGVVGLWAGVRCGGWGSAAGPTWPRPPPPPPPRAPRPASPLSHPASTSAGAADAP